VAPSHLNAKILGDLRRVLADLSAPAPVQETRQSLAWPFFAAFPLTTPVYFPNGVGYVSQAYLLPAALLVSFVMTARRDSRRSPPFPPASQ
jgi:hypothetical protein